MLAVLPPLVLALLAAPASLLVGVAKPRLVAEAGAAFALLAFGATLWAWLWGGGAVEFAWVPSWNLRFEVSLDGLATLYALLAFVRTPRKRAAEVEQEPTRQGRPAPGAQEWR